MCGICGIALQAEKSPSEEVLLRMVRLLRHRGPDHQGIRSFPGAGLGSCRLSIIDVAGGAQPISNESGTIWVVFNGELINYDSLRKQLIERGHRFATQSDTEVIVHLYEERGLEGVRDIRGMFAFALWDRDRSLMVLARDRLGIKPLFYASVRGVLYFASEIRSLRVALPNRPDLRLEAVDDFMTLGYVPGPKTIFEHIYQLPPGCVLQWGHGMSRVWPYWVHRSDSHLGMDERQAAQELRGRLEETVRAWMVSDVPIGVFLSGGIDSSAITALMCRAGGSRVKTFSVGFTDPRFDELRYARAVSAHYGTEHHELVVEPDQTVLIPKVVWHLDAPFADDSALPTFLVSRLAAQSVKVVLSGDGGDELFGGYPWTYRDQARRWYRVVPLPMRRVLEATLLNGHEGGYARGWIPVMRRVFADAAGQLEQGYLRRVTVPQNLRRQIYGPILTASLNGYDGASRVEAVMDAATVKDPREKMLFADQTLYLPDDILFKVDRMSMAHSLEARPPLLDHHLVEFAGTIPFGLKVRGLTSKYLLKRAIRGLVPPMVLAQRKQGFSMPVGAWLRGPLASTTRNLLVRDESPLLPGLWNRDFISWMLEAHQRGTHDFGRRLWGLLIFETWSRMHLDTRVTAQPEKLADL